MKLSQKLLIAPLATAVVLFALSFVSNRTMQSSRLDAEEKVAVVIGSLGCLPERRINLVSCMLRCTAR